MGELLAQLLPAAVVGGLAPLPIIVAISLLMAPQSGLTKAISFVGALVAAFAVIGVVVLVTVDPEAGSQDKGSAVTGTIVAVLGALLLVMAAKQMVHAPDPDAGPPGFMQKLDTMSSADAALLGLIIALINVKQLGIYVGGVSQIVAADVSRAESWVALVLLLVLIQSGVLAAVVVYTVARATAIRVLGAFRAWLVAHNREISIVLGLVVGTWFVIKGITQIAS